MVKRFNPQSVHSPLSKLSTPIVHNSVASTSVAMVQRFDPDSLQKSGSKPSPKQMYHFASENNAQFLMKCVSDTGNCRTLVSSDIADKWNIPLHPATVNDTLNTVTGKKIKVTGQIMLEATFNNKTCYFDCLVTSGLEHEILVSWHDAEAIGAVKFTQNEKKSLPRCGHIKEKSIEFVEESQENVEKKKEHFKSKYPNVLRDKLPANYGMRGPKVHITLSPDCPDKPKKAKTAYLVPVMFREKAKQVIIDLMESGVIKKLEIGQKARFCSRGMFVAKPGGVENGVRLVVDFKEYNYFIERPIHPFVPGNDIIKNIEPGSKCFSTLDFLWGYFQCPLDEESQEITTFLCEFGTFQYKVCPMGLCNSSDEFVRRSDYALAGLPGVVKLIDDVLIMAENYPQLYERIENVLKQCEEHNIILSVNKFKIGDPVVFSGFNLGSTGVFPTNSRTKAITDFPAPKTLKQLRSFLGLAQQLAHMVPDLAMANQPLYELNKVGVLFVWEPTHQTAFEMVKSILTSPLVLRNFVSTRKTELVVDASKIGLGWALLQEDPTDEHWHLVQCGSRTLSDCERRYSICELEMLGATHAILKCRHWLLGLSGWLLITDHKGLIGTFIKPLNEIGNARQRNFREKLQEYVFKAVWRKGVDKTISIADCLSRNPLFKDPTNEEDEDEDGLRSCRLDTSTPLGNRCGKVMDHENHDPQLSFIWRAADACNKYQKIITAILEKMKWDTLPKGHPGIPFKPVWKDLSIHETGLIVIDKLIVPPEACRAKIVDLMHTSHCGESKSIHLAKERFYWPGMVGEVRTSVQKCKPCLALRKTQERETRISETASEPMSDIGSDIFEFQRKKYIVIVDRYSSFLICKQLPTETANAVIKILDDLFLILGRPQRLRADRGVQYYAKETQQYCEDNFIDPEFSSPKNPSSNGLSEGGVKRAKSLLEKCKGNWKIFKNALYEFNNVPMHGCVKSPAQLFFCRRQRTSIPCLTELLYLDPEAVITAAELKIDKRVKQRLQLSCQGKNLPELAIGQRVVIQNNIDSKSIRSRWDIFGVIITKRRTGSYTIDLDKGGQIVRNRVHIMPDKTNRGRISAQYPEDKAKISND